MKGLKALAATVLGVALLASPAPASAGAVAYKHYVGCGLTEQTAPARACPEQSKKGAFFESLDADVFYTVCVKFPNHKHFCKVKQEAVKGQLYVNEITHDVISGKHKVTWFVSGKRVGSYSFTVGK
jgi:hypothetical protein